MSQCQRLLRYLQDVGPVNPLDAWIELGIYRLAARVDDLRKQGFKVCSRRTVVTNRHGEKFRVATYSLGE